jgi:RNA polymerase sigma-70 factor (ECF subfamily)
MERGDKLACSELYARFSRPLYSVALRILNDRPSAENVVNEVFLSFQAKPASYAPDQGSAFARAITLTRRLAIDRLHHRPGIDAVPSVSPVEDLSPEHSSALLPEEIATLELAFFSGLGIQKIASQLNEPAASIKARVRLGLLKLRHRSSRRHD